VALSELRPGGLGTGKGRRALSAGISLHAKAVMVDGKSVLIGSMNLDPRSRLSNTEIAVLVDSEELGVNLGTWLDEATSLDRSFMPGLTRAGDPDAPVEWISREDGQLRRDTSEPLTGWWQRMVAALLGLLIPEELL
jgi:putative cardiolipin synthase